MSLITPPYLQKGDTVAITAPASRVNKKDLEEGLTILKSWGLNVIVGHTIGNNHFNFSASDSERKDEFQEFLNNPDIKLILCARGGYGITRYIDQLDFSILLKAPKWICGFSDVTAMLLRLNNLGVAAIHGPMCKTLPWDKKSTMFLKNILFGEKTNYKWKPNKRNVFGETIGKAIGGNLTLLVNNIGTAGNLISKNNILFIEDIDEPLYAIDRMMTQLLRAGYLKDLAGIVVGDFSNTNNNGQKFGYTIQEIVLSKISEYNYPVAFNFNFGHESKNYPIVFNRNYKLSVDTVDSQLIMI